MGWIAAAAALRVFLGGESRCTRRIVLEAKEWAREYVHTVDQHLARKYPLVGWKSEWRHVFLDGCVVVVVVSRTQVVNRIPIEPVRGERRRRRQK